jgi:hypothetical protein
MYADISSNSWDPGIQIESSHFIFSFSPVVTTREEKTSDLATG